MPSDPQNPGVRKEEEKLINTQPEASPDAEEAMGMFPETPASLEVNDASELAQAREVLSEASEEAVRTTLTTPEATPALQQAHDTLAAASTDEARIAELLTIAREHGIEEAERLAEKTKSAHVIDEVHDRFVNEQQGRV